MFGDFFGRIFQAAQALLVPIPLDNALAYLYVFLNWFVTIVFGTGDPEGGVGLPF